MGELYLGKTYRDAKETLALDKNRDGFVSNYAFNFADIGGKSNKIA